MDSTSLPYHEEEEGNLIANVCSLRDQLLHTERRLQHLGEQLYSDPPSNSSVGRPSSCVAATFTLKEVEPFGCARSLNLTHEESMPFHPVESLRRSRTESSSIAAASYKLLEQENLQFRDQLNKLREQNASVVSQNQYLRREVESIKSLLLKSKTRVQLFESAFGAQSLNVPHLEERLHDLEADVQAQEKALRDTEDQLAESLKLVAEKDQTVQRCREELKKVNRVLSERDKLGKRVEQQRNEALFNAEEQTKAFQKYKEKIAEKLEKIKEEEESLHTKLLNSQKENQALQDVYSASRVEVENLQEQLRMLTSESDSGKERLQILEAKNAKLIELLTQSDQRMLKLESEREDKENILALIKDTRRENEDLKAYTAKQNERLLFFQKEIGNSKSELGNFKVQPEMHFDTEMCKSKCKGPARHVGRSSPTDVDAHSSDFDPRNGTVDIRPSSRAAQDVIADRFSSGCAVVDGCSCNHGPGIMIADQRTHLSEKEKEWQKTAKYRCPRHGYAKNEFAGRPESEDLEREPVKLQGNQEEECKYKRLELTCKTLEKEKEALYNQIQALKTKLTKAEAETSSVKASMSQRTCQFQVIQQELLEKAEKSSKLEREMAKKRSEILALETELKEKTNEYSPILTRNMELEDELSERNDHIRNLETLITNEYDQTISTLENTQKNHKQQMKKQEEEIDQLHCKLEMQEMNYKEQETMITELQQDVLAKQRTIESLDHHLMNSKMEMETQKLEKDESIQMLQNQVAEHAVKVKFLDSALEVCKGELQLYLIQLEENQENFAKQITKKSEEMERLQMELKAKSQGLQETNEQNMCLQQSLLQQQQMLQQGTERIEELEHSQANLEEQISKLEQDLQKEKLTSAADLRKVEDKLCRASQEVDLKNQKLLELTSKMRDTKQETQNREEELARIDEELRHLRYEDEAKGLQLSHMEITLRQTQADLNNTTALVTSLKEDLNSSEGEKRNLLKKREELESELWRVQEELKSNFTCLKDLQDAMPSLQLSLEEKKTAIKDLTAELRLYKSEIELKDHELDDLKQTLKDRNWDLKQRAVQLTQLDMNIQEHRDEMQQTIFGLESALNASKLEIENYKVQIANLDEKLQHTVDQLQEKDFEVLQKEQQFNQQTKEIERKQRSIADLEKIVKEHEQCILDQHQDALDIGQQMRQSRDQIQHLHSELTENRQQLLQAQRENDRLTRELEEINCSSQDKESRANSLAEDLGACQTRVSEQEIRLKTEIQKLKEEMQSLKLSYQEENRVLRESHENIHMYTDNDKSASHYYNERLYHLTHELEEAQDRISNLQTDLQARNQVIQATHEALLVKESEVIRLQARISGYERTAGVAHLQSSLESSPQRRSVFNLSTHFPAAGSKHRTIHRSISADDLSMLEGKDSLSVSSSILDDFRPLPADSELTMGDNRLHHTTDDTEESSFNPLTYSVDSDLVNSSSDSADFGTLSGMLKYITREMKKS